MCLYSPMELPFLLFISSCKSRFSLSLIFLLCKELPTVLLLQVCWWGVLSAFVRLKRHYGASAHWRTVSKVFANLPTIPFPLLPKALRGCVVGVAEFRMISFVWNILQELRGICPMPSHSLRQEPRSWFSVPEAGLMVRNQRTVYGGW